MIGALALLFGSATAIPLYFNESRSCPGPLCVKPDMPYERISATQPGYQWNDAGGYCGSWSIQRASLAKGAYISQQQVRDHTSPGGGHDNEILSTNIDEALKNLKLSAEGFDYTDEPLPQQDAYFKWLKRQLVSGFPVPWMIMWNGQNYPIYNLTPPAGMYGHVEPVVGIMSNHPLTDETVYPDDVIVHFTDGGINTVYAPISTLPGTWEGMNSPAKCTNRNYCIGPYSFGWAVQGFLDHTPYVPASLHIEPWMSEPDTRSGETPEAIQGTLTVSELTVGASYDIYRWDSVDDAFTYTDTFKKTSFTAKTDTFVYKDPQSFQSDSATYYRCVAQ